MTDLFDEMFPGTSRWDAEDVEPEDDYEVDPEDADLELLGELYDDEDESDEYPW